MDQIKLIEEGLEGTWTKDKTHDKQPTQSLDFSLPETSGDWGKLDMQETGKEFIPMEYKIVLREDKCFILLRVEGDGNEIDEYEFKNYPEIYQMNSWIGFLHLKSPKGSENYTRLIPRPETL